MDIVIKVINKSDLKNVSSNTLDLIVTFKTGIKTNEYWITSIRQFPIMFNEKRINDYNRLMYLLATNGYSYLQINNK